MPAKIELPEPWGPPRLRAIIQRLNDAIRAITPISTEKCEVFDMPGGGKGMFPRINRGTNPEEPAAEEDVHPFHLSDATNEEDGFQIRVYWGTINDEAPSGMSDGDDPPYYLAVSGTGQVWVGVTFDADPESETVGEITSRFINLGAGPIPDDTDDTFYHSLGTYEVLTDRVRAFDNVGGSLRVTFCRDWFSFPVKYSTTWETI